jgi:hypothetical protein
VRRHTRTGELAFYRCYSPELVPLRELVRVAGRRWAVEESFQAGLQVISSTAPTGVVEVLDLDQYRRSSTCQRPPRERGHRASRARLTRQPGAELTYLT